MDGGYHRRLDPEKERIASERTVLRPFAKADADELLSLFRDPSVRRYLLDDSVVSAEWVRDEIVASDARFARLGVGLWAIRLTDEVGIVGCVGFREFFEPPQLQLLFALLPGHWGRGLATEVADAVCRYAFHQLGFAEILAATDVPNEASVRVLQRLGMSLERTTPDGPSGTAFYVLDRVDWVARNARGGAL